MATGCLPIRDMVIFPIYFKPTGCGPWAFASLPDVAQQLAAEPLGAGLAVADDALAGADDGDAQAVEDRAEVLVAAINAAAGLAHPLDAADDALPLGAVFQVD